VLPLLFVVMKEKGTKNKVFHESFPNVQYFRGRKTVLRVSHFLMMTTEYILCTVGLAAWWKIIS
jgi:uncharacterized membrane protein